MLLDILRNNWLKNVAKKEIKVAKFLYAFDLDFRNILNKVFLQYFLVLELKFFKVFKAIKHIFKLIDHFFMSDHFINKAFKFRAENKWLFSFYNSGVNLKHLGQQFSRKGKFKSGLQQNIFIYQVSLRNSVLHSVIKFQAALPSLAES